MNKAVLIDTLANICHYAQEHSCDTDAWDRSHLHDQMGHVSYVVACFISQNTRNGNTGVEWDVVLSDLCGEVHDYTWWKQYFKLFIFDFEGMLTNEY